MPELAIEYGIIRSPELRGKIIELPVCDRCKAVVSDPLGHTKWHQAADPHFPPLSGR